VDDEALVPVEPGADLGMLVGGVVVEDDVDHLAGRHLGLDRVQEAHDGGALRVAADDGPVEDVDRRPPSVFLRGVTVPGALQVERGRTACRRSVQRWTSENLRNTRYGPS
jgi:hypothetical protein